MPCDALAGRWRQSLTAFILSSVIHADNLEQVAAAGECYDIAQQVAQRATVLSMQQLWPIQNRWLHGLSLGTNQAVMPWESLAFLQLAEQAAQHHVPHLAYAQMPPLHI